MTTKPPWTDEEKFWNNTRQALLGFVDAIETYWLARHTKVRTAEIRKWLRSYMRVHPICPIAAEDVRERIEELREEAGVLTTEPEHGKL